MYRKKFIPPLLKKVPSNADTATSEPPLKKIKLEKGSSQDDVRARGGGSQDSTGGSRIASSSQSNSKPISTKFLVPQVTRKPLAPVLNPPATQTKDVKSETGEGGRNYYNVLWYGILILVEETPRLIFVGLGENIRRESTRPGIVMVFWQ